MELTYCDSIPHRSKTGSNLSELPLRVCNIGCARTMWSFSICIMFAVHHPLSQYSIDYKMTKLILFCSIML